MGKIIEEIKNYTGYIQKYIDKKFEGSCPCFWGRLRVDGHYISLHGHCWRTTGNSLVNGCKCAYNGLHIKTKLTKKEVEPLIKAIVKQLDSQEWYSNWEVVYD